MDFYTSLVYARTKPLVGKLAYYLLKLLGAEIPCSVPIGEGFELAHGGFGVVIHSKTTIGNRVKIEDDVIISPGAKVLCKEGVLHVGRGSVIGANAVLLESTGENEMWVGIPAHRLGMRQDQ
jgi:serine O-acetyltransferase